MNATQLLLSLLLEAYAASDVGGCSYRGTPLYGKVKFVQNFADFDVQVVNSFPDLKVKKVQSFPKSCGMWQVVDSFPDFTVRIVDSFPDFKIQFVQSFPGVVK